MKHLVLASMPRTGSTLLAEMLALHPSILGFTEIFNDDPELRKKCHGRIVGDGGLFAYDPNGAYGRPDLYLDLLEAVAALKGKSVLAYKLMESQCPALYPELAHRQSFLVSIRRENLVALAASWKIAVATNRWHCTTEADKGECGKVRVRVTPEDVEGFARREAQQLEQIKRTRLPVISLTYREISLNPQRAAKLLFDLIEVAPLDVKPTQIKVNTRPLSEMVENLEELREQLSGGSFAWMPNNDKGAM